MKSALPCSRWLLWRLGDLWFLFLAIIFKMWQPVIPLQRDEPSSSVMHETLRYFFCSKGFHRNLMCQRNKCDSSAHLHISTPRLYIDTYRYIGSIIILYSACSQTSIAQIFGIWWQLDPFFMTFFLKKKNIPFSLNTNYFCPTKYI